MSIALYLSSYQLSALPSDEWLLRSTAADHICQETLCALSILPHILGGILQLQ